jgi:putative phosphoribosyl transferase
LEKRKNEIIKIQKNIMVAFKDREEAGRLLAQKLKQKIKGNELVVGITNGGVLVAKAIAVELNLKLFAIVVKKIPSSIDSELGIGAVTSGGEVYLNEEVIHSLSEDEESIKERIQKKMKEAIEKEKIFGKLPNVKGKVVILVDDGAATSASVFAALKELKKKGAKVIVALPVSSKEAYEKFRNEADDVVCLIVDENLFAVGEYYSNFEHDDDSLVLNLLKS